MRVLVTGGCGFIGSHLVRLLVAAGNRVVVLDKLTYAGNPKNLEGVEHVFHRGDIADPVAVAAAAEGVSAVVNVAAETHVDRSIAGATEFVNTNVLGTQVLLDWARDHGVRYVQVSTDEVYGDVEAPIKSREGDQIAPSSPYAASKAAGDLLVLAYVRTHGIDAVISRGSNTYGPNQYPEKLIPFFTTNALDGKPLPVYGDGKQMRDWLHVEDHAAGIELVLREGKTGEVYNIAGGEEVENVEITRRIVELTGADPALVTRVEDRPGHDRRYALDATKLHALGWSPMHSLDDGLPSTVEWFRTNRAWWEPLKSQTAS